MDNLIGVDVDSKLLVCAIQRSGKSFPIASFDNTAAGHRKFIKWATKHGKRARVCLEATGVYSLQFALALHRTKDIEVMVANPKAIKKFGEASMARGKTDAMDAEVILEFLIRMPFQAWQPPSDEIIELQSITRRIVQLTTERTRERNRLHAADRKGIMGDVIAHDIELNIRHLERRIAVLERAALDLVNSVPELKEKFERLISVKGIAVTAGLQLLAELSALPPDMKAAQWVAHAGLDPRPYESGTSTNKPRRITKAGNRYLRAALYMPALVAIQTQANIKAFYEKLIERGKKPMQAIVAVMRKLLLCIWGMLRHEQDFDGEKFFKLAEAA